MSDIDVQAIRALRLALTPDQWTVIENTDTGQYAPEAGEGESLYRQIGPISAAVSSCDIDVPIALSCPPAAAAFIAAAPAIVDSLLAAVDARDEKIDALRHQIAALQQQIDTAHQQAEMEATYPAEVFNRWSEGE